MKFENEFLLFIMDDFLINFLLAILKHVVIKVTFNLGVNLRVIKAR